MASNATNHPPGRLTRAFHWLFPRRRCMAITVGVEIGLSLIGLPTWVHLAVVALLHLALAWEA